jgi:hypothetical protein
MAAGTGWRSMSPQEKKAFYALASKKELTDTYARARFKREPWYLTDKRLRERRGADGQDISAGDESCGV